MFAQAANSELFRLLERIDPDFLGVIGLVATVMCFALLIISVVTIFRTFQNISLAKLQNQMINELLSKGYSVDEIQRLVHGGKRNVLFRFFDNSRQAYVNRQPTAPVKTS